jgi:predicted TIM-barrel enzyme
MVFEPSDPDIFSLIGFSLIGIVQVPPMPGCRGSPGLEEIIDFTIENVITLERSGFHGVLIETRGDSPVPHAARERYIDNLARVVKVIKAISSIKVGVSVLYGAHITLCVAQTSDADFVRMCYPAANLLAASSVGHREWLWPRPTDSVGHDTLLDLPHTSNTDELSREVHERYQVMASSQGENVVVVTGRAADLAPTIQQCREAKRRNRSAPIFVGSGFNVASVNRLCGVCDGALVDSAIQIDGRCSSELCRRLVAAVRDARGRAGQQEAELAEQRQIVAA